MHKCPADVGLPIDEDSSGSGGSGVEVLGVNSLKENDVKGEEIASPPPAPVTTPPTPAPEGEPDTPPSPPQLATPPLKKLLLGMDPSRIEECPGLQPEEEGDGSPPVGSHFIHKKIFQIYLSLGFMEPNGR